jgi:aminoglycoside phosphotransferase (APT) family kinase protein|tara:strand:- start:689 stop:1615 length:927 start_codon:yes stop_codon:yes gene_type:complete
VFGERFVKELASEQIVEGLHFTFPELASLQKIEILENGFSSYVVLAADEYVFRIAKHTQAMQGHVLENQVLPRIEAYLPTRIPHPHWHQDPNDYFPFGVTGYRYIPGVPLSPKRLDQQNCQQIAQDLAAFLLALHEIPLQELQDCGLKKSADLQPRPDEVSEALALGLDKDEQRKVIDWWKAGLETESDRYTARLLHGDLWFENIILDGNLGGVVGVVDFESMLIGDIARDLAPLSYLGEKFLNLLVRTYREKGGRLDDDLPRRMRQAILEREVGGLIYALRYPESNELVDSLAKIRQLLVSMERSDY